MLEKDFAPYEPSLALKELGFDEPCFAFYNGKFIQSTEFDFDSYNSIDVGHHPLAPTFSQAFRWFREKHNTHSFIIPLVDEMGFVHEYQVRIHIEESSVEIIGNFEIYEEAELACLIKLIEIVKNKQ